MASPLITATVQASILSAISNILAQALRSYNNGTPFEVDWTPLIHFLLFTFLSTPPNFLWQSQLEAWFPGQVPVKVKDEKGDGKKTEMKFSTGNTVKKFVTDQLIGAPVNTVLFLAAMGYLRGLQGEVLVDYVKREFVPLTIAGLKLWPAVSIISFSMIPAEKRIVFGSLVALGWNVYLGLVMG